MNVANGVESREDQTAAVRAERDRRVAHIAGMMARGEWGRRSAESLAQLWTCHVSTIKRIAAEARPAGAWGACARSRKEIGERGPSIRLRTASFHGRWRRISFKPPSRLSAN